MTTPITSIEMLPPIVTFLSSHYDMGLSFPLTVGVFVNGQSHSFIVKPEIHWPVTEYEQHYGGGKPLSYFYENGISLGNLKTILTKLIGNSEVILCLRDDYDPRFFHLLGLNNFIIKSVGLIDNFNNYDERLNELLKRVEIKGMNIYSVEEVVSTLAFQTFDNLKFNDLDLLLKSCKENNL